MKPVFIVAVAAVLAASLVPMHAQGQEVLLNIGCQDEPKTLNIWKATDVWSTHVDAWFYPSLFYRKPVTLEPLPDFCSMPYDQVKAASSDGLTYTFPLRNDVTWDDGVPVTAYDFEFSYNLITELQFPDYLPIYEDVEYIKAVDDYTLEIKLAKCTPQWEENVIFHFASPKQQFGPMLEEARKTEAPMQTFLDLPVDNPVSAGPFSFGQWEKGAFVKLVTNPNYYGKGRKVNVQGVGEIEEGPFYDGLILKLYGTTDAALLGIQKGEIDFIWWNLDPGYIAQLMANPDITVETSEELGFYFLAPNMAKPPFDDKVLRQALVYMVDKEFIVSRVLQGYGGVAHSVVMPAAGPWYNPNVNKFGSGMARADRIAKAKEMLTAAGYTVPEGTYPEGVIKLPNGQDMAPFEILTPSADYDPMRAMCGVLIQEWWREIGVPVTAKPTSFGEIVHATYEAMTFDWYILGWRIGGTGYPDHLRYFFHSDQAVPDGNNPMSYKNPENDRLLDDLMSNCDRNALIQDAWKSQEMIVDDVAYCSLYYRTMNEAHRNDHFTGWFTQLGGIAGTESPRHCLLYLKPTGPCINIVCGNTCKGLDLWSQKCVKGDCVDDQLLETNSAKCGACQDHCINGKQDCGEYGIDCGGGCPFTDSDGDGVEDCKDTCPNSLCDRVDSHGCEIDRDNDGVTDCVDECPTEPGNPSNNGCPGFNRVTATIGIVLVVAGGFIIWRLRGRAREKEDMQKRGGVTTDIWLTEKLISGFWVYPYVKTTQEAHQVTLAIVKGLYTEEAKTPLLGQVVDVGLLDVRDNSLQVVQRPEDGPLPVVGSISISANAGFLFTVSGQPLKRVQVTIEGETKTFNMGETTTARGEKKVARRITCLFKKCCVNISDIPAHRSGRQLTGNRLHESFEMKAEFDAKDKCRCRRCEYRQHIRGVFTFDRVPAIHQLPDGPLDPVVWREDGVPHHYGRGCHIFYGHRDDPETPVDIYRNPDRAAGHQYQGYDNPLIGHPNPKVAMVMNLEFRGEIIDVGSGKVIRTTTWTVSHSQP